MNINMNYLINHVSWELHTMTKIWKGNLSPDIKPDIICTRNDLKDEYLPFSVFADFIAAENIPEPSSCPLIFSVVSSEKQLVYAYISVEDQYLLMGPVMLTSPVQINSHLELPSLDQKNLTPVLCCNFYFFCSNILLIHNLFRQSTLSRDELIYLNCTKESTETEVMRDYSSLIFERQELEEPHNPYDQEIRESASIENGDMEMFKKSISEDYTGKLGTLSKNELRNAKNLAIVLMTLASRASIRGGLLPEISFSMSDVFIQKIEEMTDPVIILNTARQFQMEYVKAVAEIRQQKQDSESTLRKNIWIEQCKDYIFKHLHEKICSRDIAEYLHLNANYLSELFKKYENITLTDFILKEKVKLARNLLSYSPYSYIEIATYLGFSSQSHLGKVFKKYTGMTMRQYREKYKRNFG